jgi:hypothetical protein
MTIKLFTQLDKGIYRSQRGGEIQHFGTWDDSSVLAAVKELLEHRAYMIDCYGNIGCGQSWLERDGVRIEAEEIEEYEHEAQYDHG